MIHVIRREVGDFAPAVETAEQRTAAIAAAFDQRAVRLDPERVDAEDQRLPAVLERIQEDLNRVVRIDAVAVRERRVYGARCRARLHAEVDRVRRVEHQHVGRIVGRTAVHRRVLREVGQPSGLLPDRFVQHPIDRDRGRVHARDRDMYLIVAAAEGRGGQGERECREHGFKDTISVDAIR